jgi:hypothetical protein
MKSVVFILVLLAGLKLGHQEYLYRVATRDLILTAYKDRAVQACLTHGRNVNLGLQPQAWIHPASIKLVIGKSGLDVQLWQVDSDLWNVRYRNPFLVLTADARGAQVSCEYDIVNAAATVHRL